MTNSMKRNPRGGRGPRVILYTLGILIAVMAGVLIKSTTSNNASKSAELTNFSPLTVAPVANQAGATGTAIVPITPTATDTQNTATPIVVWSAQGLPPGITISHGTGLLSGTPNLAGTYEVTLTARDNTHPPTFSSTTFSWTISNNGPVVSQVVPVLGDGAGGMRVVVTGANFQGATSVTFGGVAAGGITVNRRGDKVVVFAPPHSAGIVDVQVTSLGGTSAEVPADQFTYVAPHINFVSNANGSVLGGTRVTISGSGLTGATAVTFGGVEAADFSVRHHGTQIVAISPRGEAGAVTMVVTTPGGTTDSGANHFTYSVNPPKASAAKKTTKK